MNVLDFFRRGKPWDRQQYTRFWDLPGGVGRGLNSMSVFWLLLLLLLL